MKLKTFVTSSAVAVLGALSFNASATYCYPPTSGGGGGCDGTGVNFKAIQSTRTSGPADTITTQDINIGKQLDLKLSSAIVSGKSAVLFTFRNIGSISSSLVDIHFDDVDSSPLLRVGTTSASGIKWYQDGSSTKYAMDSVIQALPGVAVNTRYGFGTNYSADSVSGSFTSTDYSDGVNQTTNVNSTSEFVTFVGFLASGRTTQNVIDAINNNTFQIGLNVATFNSTTCKYDFNAYLSENCLPPSPVPLPAAAWLFGSALIGFVTISNRRRV